jgi:succinyl-CoA synthetase beta subunit
MNIHEYQAKAVLREFGVPVPRGQAVFSVEEAVKAAKDLGAPVVVVKAQIHAGGRGKAGGVKIASTPEETAELADQMLGSTLVTAQTGAQGQHVSRLLVERASRIEREFYLSLFVDRDSQRVVVIASAEGGVDIEDVAARDPDAIHTEYVDPGVGLLDFQGQDLTAGGAQRWLRTEETYLHRNPFIDHICGITGGITV